MSIFGLPIPKLGLWFWRRIMTWGIVVAVHVTVGWIVWASPGAAYLGYVALGLIAEAVIVYTFYFSGATVSDWAKLAASVSPGMKIGLGGVHAGPTIDPPTENGPPSP